MARSRPRLAKVRASEAWPATKLAFEFLVLSACRSGEVRGARWEEIDPGGRDLDSAVLANKGRARAAGTTVYGRALGVLDGARALADGSGLVFASPTGRRADQHSTLSGAAATTGRHRGACRTGSGQQLPRLGSRTD